MAAKFMTPYTARGRAFWVAELQRQVNVQNTETGYSPPLGNAVNFSFSGAYAVPDGDAVDLVLA